MNFAARANGRSAEQVLAEIQHLPVASDPCALRDLGVRTGAVVQERLDDFHIALQHGRMQCRVADDRRVRVRTPVQ